MFVMLEWYFHLQVTLFSNSVSRKYFVRYLRLEGVCVRNIIGVGSRDSDLVGLGPASLYV